ncbi:MAG: hypothetical protein LLG04_02625 [Parachlamydia sp.]|nr:hypothetical protein [Parachlamydia sp.]
MSRILKFTSGPKDWKALLADKEKHWKKGYSARTLAHCWEAADGFPPEVSLPFSLSTDSLLANITPVFAIPEFKVSLPGGVRSSQNDIFVLARSSSGPVSIMVEGKVNESFGPTLGQWRNEASSGKKKRLNFLLRSLGLSTVPADSIRYQLLHRAASAIITGEQYRAVAAVLLVHSFSQRHTGWSDYQAFINLFDVEAMVGTIQRLSLSSSIPLFGVWVVGNSIFLQS